MHASCWVPKSSVVHSLCLSLPSITIHIRFYLVLPTGFKQSTYVYHNKNTESQKLIAMKWMLSICELFICLLRM